MQVLRPHPDPLNQNQSEPLGSVHPFYAQVIGVHTKVGGPCSPAIDVPHCFPLRVSTLRKAFWTHPSAFAHAPFR